MATKTETTDVATVETRKRVPIETTEEVLTFAKWLNTQGVDTTVKGITVKAVIDSVKLSMRVVLQGATTRSGSRSKYDPQTALDIAIRFVTTKFSYATALYNMWAKSETDVPSSQTITGSLGYWPCVAIMRLLAKGVVPGSMTLDSVKIEYDALVAEKELVKPVKTD
jgi:hypothetical protein